MIENQNPCYITSDMWVESIEDFLLCWDEEKYDNDPIFYTAYFKKQGIEIKSIGEITRSDFLNSIKLATKLDDENLG